MAPLLHRAAIKRVFTLKMFQKSYNFLKTHIKLVDRKVIFVNYYIKQIT